MLKRFGLGLVFFFIVVVQGCTSSGLPSEPAEDGKVDEVTAPPRTPSVAAALASGSAYCKGKAQPIAPLLLSIAESIEQQAIPYPTRSNPAPNEWRDCSGNFLRFSSYVAKACPEQSAFLAAPSGVRDYKPGSDASNVVGVKPAARTTRSIAKWYHRANRFTPIYYAGSDADALEAVRDRIQPGTVLWFSYQRTSRADGVAGMFSRSDQCDLSKKEDDVDCRHINHMGTVVAVKRDAANKLVGYSMFHGLRPGKKAGITPYHRWSPRGSKPKLGFGSQYLVGYANLIPGG